MFVSNQIWEFIYEWKWIEWNKMYLSEENEWKRKEYNEIK